MPYGDVPAMFQLFHPAPISWIRVDEPDEEVEAEETLEPEKKVPSSQPQRRRLERAIPPKKETR